MVRIVMSRALRFRMAALIAVFAGVLLAPRTSEAGCGNYVEVNGLPTASAHISRVQSAMKDGAANHASNGNSRHHPCQGPSCSGGSYPPLEPVSITVVSTDRWAVVDSDANVALTETFRHLLAETADSGPDGFRSSILRPPR